MQLVAPWLGARACKRAAGSEAAAHAMTAPGDEALARARQHEEARGAQRRHVVRSQRRSQTARSLQRHAQQLRQPRLELLHAPLWGAGRGG
jgi:hypothetical protein